MSTTQAEIDRFLTHRRIAMVGASRNPKDFSRVLFRELLARGYDVVPVNPLGDTIEGRPCFDRVQQIEPPVEAALIMTKPAETEKVVRHCDEAGIREVWMHRGGGQGAVSPAAVAFCRERGMTVVEGQCPFMFLPNNQFVHRMHGFIRKVVGHYPAAA